MLRRMRWLGRGRVRVVRKKLLAILAETCLSQQNGDPKSNYIRKANNRMQRSICNYESEGSRVLRG